MLAIVPPLLAWAAYVPRKSDPLLSSSSDVRIVWRFGGMFDASISVGWKMMLSNGVAPVVDDEDTDDSVSGDEESGSALLVYLHLDG